MVHLHQRRLPFEFMGDRQPGRFGLERLLLARADAKADGRRTTWGHAAMAHAGQRRSSQPLTASNGPPQTLEPM